MKKLILASAVALLSAGGAQAGANVYASALKSADGKVQFVLNDAATIVVFNLIKDGEIIESVELGEGVKGLNTIEVPALASDPGMYEWSLTVSAPAVTEVTQITDSNDAVLAINNARGISFDKTLTSPYFGRMYVTSANTNYGGTRKGQGIFVFDGALTDFTEQGNSPYSGGVAWSGASSPCRVYAAPDGKVWICDWSDGHSGVWIMDPANPSADFTEFFGGTRDKDGLAKDGDVQVHGSIVDLCVTGTGEDTKLYTLDEDIITPEYKAYDGKQAWHMPYRYDIGNASAPYLQAPNHCYGNFDTKYVNGSATINPDGRGGLWVGQNRDTNSATFPCAMHINANGNWDYYCGDPEVFPTSSVMGALGVSADGKYIAVAGKKNVRVAEVTYDENNTPSLSLKWPITSASARPHACDFDPAGNIYVAYNDNPGGVTGWALPKEKNEFTTPALEAVEVGGSGIQTGLHADKIGVSAIAYAGNTLSAAGAELEVYNIAGMKVAEGYRVDTTTLPAGIYVVRSGANTLKIRK